MIQICINFVLFWREKYEVRTWSVQNSAHATTTQQIRLAKLWPDSPSESHNDCLFSYELLVKWLIWENISSFHVILYSDLVGSTLQRVYLSMCKFDNHLIVC